MTKTHSKTYKAAIHPKLPLLPFQCSQQHCIYFMNGENNKANTAHDLTNASNQPHKGQYKG